MDRDEDIALRLVGDQRPFLQRQLRILGASHDDAEGVVLEQLAESMRDVECQLLFHQATGIGGAQVAASVPGSEDDLAHRDGEDRRVDQLRSRDRDRLGRHGPCLRGQAPRHRVTARDETLGTLPERAPATLATT